MHAATLPARFCSLPGSSGPRAIPPYRRYVDWPLAEGLIRSGDILLWRPTTLVGAAIAWATGGGYSHAAMAGWWNENLLAVEMLQFHGGRVARLDQQIRQWSGHCDVYRPKTPYLGYEALREMIAAVGQDYGWGDLAYIAAHRVLRLDRREIPNSDDPDAPRVCSAAVAYAARLGGKREVWPGAHDAEVEPSDLARNEFAEYCFTPVVSL